ncbi:MULTISPECIES: hypothetical protein [Nostocales]|nr:MULTISPECIES: hypothetical protein [Nostocales]
MSNLVRSPTASAIALKCWRCRIHTSNQQSKFLWLYDKDTG